MEKRSRRFIQARKIINVPVQNANDVIERRVSLLSLILKWFVSIDTDIMYLYLFRSEILPFLKPKSDPSFRYATLKKKKT